MKGYNTSNKQLAVDKHDNLILAGFNIKVVSRYIWHQSAMICAKSISVFIFSALLSFHCCNGKYLLLETEDENGMNGEGGEFKFSNEPLDNEMGSLEADLTENESINRSCPFCQPDVPGVDGHGIGK